MKKIKAAVLGYGNRGKAYSQYAVDYPDELEIVAVIDTNDFARSLAKEKFNLNDDQLYKTLDDFLAEKVKCDVVFNTTMDQLHYKTAMKLLNAKYNLLLEKPITSDEKELLDIRNTAKKNGCTVIVCHVLRYTPFYMGVKEIIDSGEIGPIIDMQLNEHVGMAHFVKAYVRGKWHSQKECGSSLLLAKCCHDTDLLCWLNNTTKPEYVSSFGDRKYFTESHAPEGATQFCYQCPNKDTCMFNAYKFEIEQDVSPIYTWARIDKPHDQITLEEKVEYLKHDIFGQCVFKIKDMDIVDRQCVSVKYENGSVATLHVVGGCSRAGRHLHIIGELGEIDGYIEENKFRVTKFAGGCDDETRVIDLNVDLSGGPNSMQGHYGGDTQIVSDLVKTLNGLPTSTSTTTIDDSVYGHLCCYAADEAMNKNEIICLKGKLDV